jgi:hypothetical protein
MSGTSETPEEAMEAVEQQMQRDGAHDAKVDEEVNRDVGWVPGQKINRRFEAAWAEDGKFPAEEAEQTARTAAGVAQAADEERAELTAEAQQLDTAQPGSALDQEARTIAAEAAALATDAENAGFAVSQDALNAKGFDHQHLEAPAEAAEDQAQADLHRAAHDLAVEDALKAELEGDVKAGQAGATPSPLPPAPPATAPPAAAPPAAPPA